MSRQSSDLSFARLVPVNKSARVAFAKAIETLQARGDGHQLRFYKDDTNHLIPDPQSAFANLSLSSSALPKYPRIGWRVGHINERTEVKVHIAERDGETEDLSGHEFRLFVHPRSGLLCLEAGITDLPLSYADRAQRLVRLRPRERIVFSSPINKIELGPYRFQIEYTVSEDHAGCFFEELERFLREHHRCDLHAAGHMVPSLGFPSFYGRFMVGGKLGSGTYGDVHYGVDTQSGEPVALKSIRLQNSGWRRETTNEIVLLGHLQGLPHCLQLVETWCHDHKVHPKDCPGGADKETFYVATELGLSDFSDPTMRDLPFAKILELVRQLLIGLQHLQRKGIMHRDITLRNSICHSIEPAKAVLGDLGKAVMATQQRQTAIGPTPNCAPEVWSGCYTNTIDLWSWGYMMAQFLGYEPEKAYRAEAITQDRLEQIIRYLRDWEKARESDDASHFVDLLTKILIWEPEKRITVIQALQHRVWKAMPGIEWEEDLSSDNGEPSRKRRRDESAKSEDYSSVETVPFSD